MSSMRRIIQNPAWWLPVTAGLLAVLFFTTVVLRMGPQPAVAPGRPAVVADGESFGQLIQSVSLDGVIREYRGWLEVPAGQVTVRIHAKPAAVVKVIHWALPDEPPVVDATVLSRAPDAARQPDGTWVATWTMPVNQQAHAIAYGLDPMGDITQSDTLNIKAVRQ